MEDNYIYLLEEFDNITNWCQDEDDSKSVSICEIAENGKKIKLKRLKTKISKAKRSLDLAKKLGYSR